MKLSNLLSCSILLSMVFSTAMGQLTSFGLGGPEDKQGRSSYHDYYWGCFDSPFMVPNPFNPTQKLDCSFLATDIGAPYCTSSIAQTHCPATCDACSTASTKDSESPFFYKGEKTTCDALKQKPFYHFFMACNDFDMVNTCRETCGMASQVVQNTYKFTMDGISDNWKMKWTDLATFHATGRDPYRGEGSIYGESGYAQGTISEPRVGWNYGGQDPIIVECPGGYFNFKQVHLNKAWDTDSNDKLIRTQELFVEAWRHDERTGFFHLTWGTGDMKHPFRLWAYPTSSGYQNITKMTFSTVEMTSTGNVTRYIAIDDFEVHITKACNLDMSDTRAGIIEAVPPGFA